MRSITDFEKLAREVLPFLNNGLDVEIMKKVKLGRTEEIEIELNESLIDELFPKIMDTIKSSSQKLLNDFSKNEQKFFVASLVILMTRQNH